MRKMTYFVMALALVLGFTQCKKEQPQPQSEGVRISLNVTNGNSNGTRANVTPPSVSFVNGDQILVASDGHYVGTLMASQSGDNVTFSGDITNPVEGEPLYFYFLGNEQGTLEAGATTCTVNISDQTKTNNKPVISMGKSTEDYASGTTSYTSRLYNKASLMKFNVTTSSTAAISILGMNNLVTVDFGKYDENGDGLGNGTNNGFSYSMDTQDGGLITMPAKGANNETWAIVLPQEALTEGNEGTAFTYDGYKGNRPALDAIASNQYITTGVDDLDVSTFDINYMALTFEAKANNSTVKFTAAALTPAVTMQYNTYDGTGWKPYTSGTAITLASIGNKVSFRGDNNTLASAPYFGSTSQFSTTGQCYIYGNIMSLLYSNDYATATTLIGNYTFSSLFLQNTSIYSHSSKALVLPATTLTTMCYYQMFINCRNLTSAPTLPAETLTNECYSSMFLGCMNLTSAPAELPATTLTYGCYSNMFEECSNLTSAPDLPAPTLVESCYKGMFYGCEKVTYIKCLATNISATDCTTGWVRYVNNSGTFVTPSATAWTTGDNGIPYGWTRVNAN